MPLYRPVKVVATTCELSSDQTLVSNKVPFTAGSMRGNGLRHWQKMPVEDRQQNFDRVVGVDLGCPVPYVDFALNCAGNRVTVASFVQGAAFAGDRSQIRGECNILLPRVLSFPGTPHDARSPRTVRQAGRP